MKKLPKNTIVSKCLTKLIIGANQFILASNTLDVDKTDLTIHSMLEKKLKTLNKKRIKRI